MVYHAKISLVSPISDLWCEKNHPLWCSTVVRCATDSLHLYSWSLLVVTTTTNQSGSMTQRTAAVEEVGVQQEFRCGWEYDKYSNCKYKGSIPLVKNLPKYVMPETGVVWIQTRLLQLPNAITRVNTHSYTRYLPPQ